MTVTSVDKDLDIATMTVTTAFAAPVERVWEIWADPRLLEKWWGPPSYPATVEQHDLTPGGEVSYYMTGPEGDQPHGLWKILEVDGPASLEFEDHFADENGNPNPEMPSTNVKVEIGSVGEDGSRMTISSKFSSPESMAELIEMGMEDGLKQALGQIDGLL
jgi:uncharacterized protein YndB with AHSA1/START domain